MFNDHVYLYIEDDPLSREIMQMIMENVMGVQNLYIFEDSTDFLQRLEGLPKRPDVILMDIHMKPYTGFEMLETLRKNDAYRETVIVALTASVMNEEVEKLRQSGFHGAIGKPLSMQTFPKLIEKILAGETIWHILDR